MCDMHVHAWDGRYMLCRSQVKATSSLRIGRWEEVLSRSMPYVCTGVLAQRSSSCSQRELVKCHQGYEKGRTTAPFRWESLPETNIGYDDKG